MANRPMYCIREFIILKAGLHAGLPQNLTPAGSLECNHTSIAYRHYRHRHRIANSIHTATPAFNYCLRVQANCVQ